MAAFANMFYIAIDYKSKTYMKVAASNFEIKILNIKIHELFPKQRMLGVRVTIVQRKISGDSARTCLWIKWRPYLWR